MSEYNTEQKKILIEYMKANSHKGLTIEEISEGLSCGEGGALGRSTLYRLMHRMTEDGSVRRFVGSDGRKATYQLVECERCDGHLHMKCTDCGGLFHMDEKVSDELLRVVNENNDFLVSESETVLYGRCSNCKSGEKSKQKYQKNSKKTDKVGKKTTKSIICCLLAVLLLILPLASCGAARDDGKVDIVCTVFPIYDWVRNIVGEDSESLSVSLIVQNGTDPHSYSPTPSDIVKISSCDILFYVGGESDLWIGDVLSGKVNEKMEKIALLELVKDRCLILDRDHSHSDGGDEDAKNDHDHDHGGENSLYDEHIWLSLKNAAHVCREISARLSAAIPEKSESVAPGAEDYIAKIEALDAEYAFAVDASAKRPLLFADRFPFGYLTEDYGIKHYEAFSGCSADSEASFGTVTELAARMDEHSLSHVIILESSSEELARTVISSSSAKGAEILRIDSMQSVTEKDILGGADYLEIMRKNLAVIKTALG